MRLFLIAAGALILLIFSGSCTKKKTVRTVEMGEQAIIGPYRYKAYETLWPLSLGERIPKDRFLVVKLTVENDVDQHSTIPSIDLVDDAGNVIPELSDGTGVEHWLGMVRTLTKDQQVDGTVVFDVAPRQYMLRVADDTDEFMYIRIPLNLNSEAPQGQPETPAPEKK